MLQTGSAEFSLECPQLRSSEERTFIEDGHTTIAVKPDCDKT